MPAGQPAFRVQLVVGARHYGPAHPESLCQCARRRQAVADAQHPVGRRGAQGVGHLHRERLGGGSVEGNRKVVEHFVHLELAC